MERRQLGALQATVGGGTDRKGGGKGPVVVLCHGFGAPGTDLVPLGRVIPVPEGTRWVFPEAPLALPREFQGGRAWWMIDIERMQLAIMRGETRDLTRDTPEGLAPAREMLIGLLDAVQEELGVDGSRIVLGGFSQGAMLALDVALHTDRALAGLVLLSGTLLAADDWIARMPARKGLPVLQSHGRSDALLPFSIAERLHGELSGAGWATKWVPFAGGHEIPGVVTDGLADFLRDRLAPNAS